MSPSHGPSSKGAASSMQPSFSSGSGAFSSHSQGAGASSLQSLADPKEAPHTETTAYVKLCLAADSAVTQQETEMLLRRIQTTGCTAAKIRVLSAASLAAGLGVQMNIAELLKDAVLSFDASIRGEGQSLTPSPTGSGDSKRKSTTPKSSNSRRSSPASANKTPLSNVSNKSGRSGSVTVKATYFDSLDGDDSEFARQRRKREEEAAAANNSSDVENTADDADNTSPANANRKRTPTRGPPSARRSPLSATSPLDGANARRSAGTPRVDMRTGECAYMRPTESRMQYETQTKTDLENPDRLKVHPYLASTHANVYDVRTMSISPQHGAHRSSYVSEFDNSKSMMYAIRGSNVLRQPTTPRSSEQKPFNLHCNARVSSRLKMEEEERKAREREERRAASSFRASPYKKSVEPKIPVRPRSAGPTRPVAPTLDTAKRSSDWVEFKKFASSMFERFQQTKQMHEKQRELTRTSMAEEKIRKASQGFDRRTTIEKGVIAPPKLSSEDRVAQREEFDRYIKEKEDLAAQLAEEQMRLRALEEEREVKELRKSLVIKATPIPDFSMPFVPGKSERELTKAVGPELTTGRRSMDKASSVEKRRQKNGFRVGDGSPPEPRNYRVDMVPSFFVDSLRKSILM